MHQRVSIDLMFSNFIDLFIELLVIIKSFMTRNGRKEIKRSLWIKKTKRCSFVRSRVVGRNDRKKKIIAVWSDQFEVMRERLRLK